MNIPTLPAGRNKYYDLGPTRQYDVDVIRRALLQYEGTMAARVKARTILTIRVTDLSPIAASSAFRRMLILGVRSLAARRSIS